MTSGVAYCWCFMGWYNIDLVVPLGWVILINWWLDFVCLVRVPGVVWGLWWGVAGGCVLWF